MVAIINQLGIGKIDRKRLQLDLGLTSIGTADARLSRFKAKLAKARGETSPAPAKAKRASPKKRKVEATEDHNSHSGDGGSDNSMVDTPTRKISGRKARVRSVEEEVVEDEVDYDFQDSGRDWE